MSGTLSVYAWRASTRVLLMYLGGSMCLMNRHVCMHSGASAGDMRFVNPTSDRKDVMSLCAPTNGL